MSVYKAAGSHIVHQKMIGEVIIVDLRAGVYFSLLGSAVNVWDALMQGLNRDETVAELSRVYEAPTEAIASYVDNAILQLLTENLICAGSPDQLSKPGRLDTPAEKAPFDAGLIQKYTDMEDVLALDPIHEFDEAGWPNVPVATTN